MTTLQFCPQKILKYLNVLNFHKESGIIHLFDTFLFIIIYLKQLKTEMICVADIQAYNQ